MTIKAHMHSSSWPDYSQEEIQAVADVLGSNRVNYWTGELGRRFEEEFAAWTGAAHAVAMANGTLALNAALRALDIGPGDEVVVTPRSFIASASCVALAGGVPVFADVDRNSQNITAETISRVITPRTRAIICVHLAGMPCDMDPIMELAGRHGLKVIEDCAQAHGARYRGRSVGTIGDIGVWSFCQDKIMTTGGEGGMTTTNDEALWSRMWSLKDHGKSPDRLRAKRNGSLFQWVHDGFGDNYRLTEMQAAIGLVQLERIEEWSRQRNGNAGRLADACRRAGLRVPEIPHDCVHAYYRFYAFTQPDRLAAGWDAARIIGEIAGAGIRCQTGICPEIYREKAFDGTGWRPKRRLEAARELGETSLAFLVHPTLTESELESAGAAIEKVMSQALRD